MFSNSLVLKFLALAGICVCSGFITKHQIYHKTFLFSTPTSGSDVTIDSRTDKRTGNSFLPSETIERASKGSPIEKIKLEKDGTSAFVDVYEYAAKIRSGEMTWEQVEKADLDTVRIICS
jgi:hypothetical protein